MDRQKTHTLTHTYTLTHTHTAKSFWFFYVCFVLFLKLCFLRKVNIAIVHVFRKSKYSFPALACGAEISFFHPILKILPLCPTAAAQDAFGKKQG